MRRSRRAWAVVAGIALVGSSQIGLATPAAAEPAGQDRDPAAATVAPATSSAVTWEEPTPGTSAEIRFTDASPAARTALSPYLSEIMRAAGQVRTIDLNAASLAPSLAAESVTVELFDDVSIALETTVAPSQGADLPDASSLAYSAGGADGAAIVTIIDGDLHGAFWQGTTRYGIKPLGGGRHLVFEDGRTFPDEAAVPGQDEPGTPRPAPATPLVPETLATGPVVDIMVAYDELAKAYFGSVAAVEAEIVEMINLTNMIIVNSQADVQVALAATYDLNYTPNAADGTTNDGNYLGAIVAKNDGIVDDLHAARDASEADLVAVIGNLNQYCGIANLPTNNNAAENSAFSLTDAGCAVGNMTFPHEVGHNFCLHHDPDNVPVTSCGPDAHGHLSAAENLRTVMSYANAENGCPTCVRIPYFSNPDVSYNGWVTGIAGARNNTRVLVEYAPSLAGYRPLLPPCEVNYVIASSWPGNVQVELVVANTTPMWINGWTAEWTFTGDENVFNSWGVTITQVGPEATAVSTGFGDLVPPGGSVTVGFQATVTGTPTVPSPISCGYTTP